MEEEGEDAFDESALAPSHNVNSTQGSTPKV
jgi:hypothetical protein